MLIKGLLNVVSPSGRGGRLSILIFHRVFQEPDPVFPQEMHASRFDALCSWLRSWCNVLPLDQSAAHLAAGTLPARAACITFDDGYADNHNVALPILSRHGLVSTFFVASGFLDGGRMWNDSIIESIRRTNLKVLDLGEIGTYHVGTPVEKFAAINAVIRKIKYLEPTERQHVTDAIATEAKVVLPEDLMMTSAQVRALRQSGMQIGAHTVSHPILARLDDGQARSEIREGKAQLERLLGEEVVLFAYPNGKPTEDYSLRSVELVRELGFQCAVSTAWGAARCGDVDMFQLPRFTPWDSTAHRFGLRLAHNMRRRGARVEHGRSAVDAKRDMPT